MTDKYDISLFIFTRDLRIYDNTSLNLALKNSKKVIPIFIFNPSQLNDKENSYKSNNCVQFMMECLDELNGELKKTGSRLFYFYDDTEDILKKIIKHFNNSNQKLGGIYINKDYTPFAKKREHIIEELCKKNNIEFVCEEDYMLTGSKVVTKGDGTTYLKFTPYYRTAMKIKKRDIDTKKYKNYISKTFSFTFEYKKSIHNFYTSNENILVHGGRKNGLKILAKIKDFKSYNKDREIPSLRGTTYLSAYLKFNVVSIREVYKTFTSKLQSSNHLITQLYWRDFYMQIMDNHKVIRHSMKENYNNIKWENKTAWIKKWKEGKTGIPIIDAAMRQMNLIGWMHNRCRMIVSNFFVKIMKCDWMIGEKYFAQNLVDYDPANNNGGWQWSASTGTDSQPYFRVFSPWRQAETYDKECEYIKTYVPELRNVENKIILKWNELYKDHKEIKYPKPMIEDIGAEFKKTLKLYH
jgi:deoxyribodipyrimidine photo-lyase